MRSPMTLVAISFSLLFVAAAAVQLNDPDPVRWIALYAGAALLCVTSTLRRPPAVLYLGFGALAAIWAATLLPEIAREVALTGNEVEREFAGLLLVAIAMALLYRHARRPAMDSSP
jgi:hypothetical protein